MAIIADDREEEVAQLIMADDGNGHSISIPSFIINKEDSQIIKQFLMQ